MTDPPSLFVGCNHSRVSTDCGQNGTLSKVNPILGKWALDCFLIKLTPLQIILFVALGSLTYGYCASIIATTLGQPSFITYFELDTRSNAADLMGAINGLFQTGGLFGTLSCITTADRFGRRMAMLIACVFSIVGGGLQAGSVNIGMYIVMRFITGIGIGREKKVILYQFSS